MLRPILGALVTLIATSAALAVPAAADVPASSDCHRSAMWIEVLSKRYGEIELGSGGAGPVRLRVFVNTESGTWSVLTDTPEGVMCMKASGKGWMQGPFIQGDPA